VNLPSEKCDNFVDRHIIQKGRRRQVCLLFSRFFLLQRRVVAVLPSRPVELLEVLLHAERSKY
jgi:hypothetical protein